MFLARPRVVYFAATPLQIVRCLQIREAVRESGDPIILFGPVLRCLHEGELAPPPGGPAFKPRRFFHLALVQYGLLARQKIFVPHDVGLRYMTAMLLVSLLRRIFFLDQVLVAVYEEGVVLEHNERQVQESSRGDLSLAEMGHLARSPGLSRAFVTPILAKLLRRRTQPRWGPIAWLTGFSVWTNEVWGTKNYRHLPARICQHLLPSFSANDSLTGVFVSKASLNARFASGATSRTKSILMLGSDKRPSISDLEATRLLHPDAELFLKPHPIRPLWICPSDVEEAGWQLLNRCVPAELFVLRQILTNNLSHIYHWGWTSVILYIERELPRSQLTNVSVVDLTLTASLPPRISPNI